MRIASPALALALFVVALPPARAGMVQLEFVGKPSVVYDTVRDACTPIDVPDINPRAYRSADGGVTMFTLHFVNRPLRGPDFNHLKIDCHVSLDSTFDPDPAHYADRSYIAATWTKDGRNVSALIHHEYHAETHNRCGVTESLGCWFNTVLAYHSINGGTAFTKSTPLVVASAPFTQDVGQGRHRGFFNPSNMFAEGRYTYAFISTTGWDGQAPGNCLFRTKDPSDSASWRGYDGARFTVHYADPYTSKAQPKPCAYIAPFLFPIGSVTWYQPGKLWVAVFQAAVGGNFPVEGFYYATGRDLTHWGIPKLLLAGRTAYSNLCDVGSSIINYPSLIDAHSASRNFDTIGDDPDLYFAAIQVDHCQTGQRMLVRQPVKLTLMDGTP